MRLIKSLPSVSLYIRITKNGKRRYERLNRRNPQRDGVYCLHFFENGQRKWVTVGTDLNEALAAKFAKENELPMQKSAPAKAAPKTLEELRTAFIHDKKTTFKKDGERLDADTITSYEKVTREFLDTIKRTLPY